MTRVYLAGPMTGYPDLNRAAFQAAAAQLRAQGHEPINPHDLPPHHHEGDCPDSYAVSDDGHSAACYLRPCLVALLGCDEVRLLPGWESSTGACRERAVAVWSGIPVTLFDDTAVEVSLTKGCGRCPSCATASGSCVRCGVRDPGDGGQLCDPCLAVMEARYGTSGVGP